MMRHVHQVGSLLLGVMLGWWWRGLMDKKGVNNMHTDEMLDALLRRHSEERAHLCEELKRELQHKQVRTHSHKYFLPARPTLP